MLTIMCVSMFHLKFDFVGFSFLILTIQSATMLSISANGAANLLTIYSIFSYTFFSIIPWIHYSDGVAIWRSAPLFPETYIFVNLAIFFANILTILAYFATSGKRWYIEKRSFVVRRKQITCLSLVGLASLGLFGVVHLSNYNVQLIVFRGIAGQIRDVVIASSSAALVLGMATRLVPVFSFYFAVTEIKSARLLKVTLFCIFLVSVFPTGVSRYMVAYTYIPLTMILFPRARNGTLFSFGLLFALLIIFPFLDQFRNFSESRNISLLPSKDFFLAGHFDAYENFASAVEVGFISNGFQLLGVLFFFVPRTLWPGKPVGSGYEMANNLNYSFDNISMPFLGEGYVNFGFIGIMVFAVFIGHIMARIDRSAVIQRRHNQHISYRMTIYYFLFGGLFFLLRGDLLSSFAYLTAGFAIAWLVGEVMRLLNTRFRV